MQTYKIKQEIADDGFAIINHVFSEAEVIEIISELTITGTSGPAFRKSGDLFAIRKVLQIIPGLAKLVFNRCASLYKILLVMTFSWSNPFILISPPCPTGL